jgi:hypothetical protein
MRGLCDARCRDKLLLKNTFDQYNHNRESRHNCIEELPRDRGLCVPFFLAFARAFCRFSAVALTAASGFSGSTPWCFLYLVLRAEYARKSAHTQNGTLQMNAPSICEPDHDSIRVRTGAIFFVH